MAAYAVVVLVRSCGEVTVGRVRSEANVGLVDALARLQLAARRLGCSLVLREVSPDLGGLLSFVGMQSLFRQPGRQTESCEEIGVQEVVDLDDPVA